MPKDNCKPDPLFSTPKSSVRYYVLALQIIGLALAYSITGKLGTFLAIPPGYATAIWPPSGIALAGVLIYGYRIWPGVFLGAFLVNFSNALVAQSLPEILTSINITLAMSFGASLQAVAGAYLVRRYAGFPNSLTREKEVLLFFLFGGILSTLVNSTIAVSALVVTGRVPITNFLTSWGTWWMGDALGVFIFTPLVLIWIRRTAEPWRNRRIAITLPISAMFVLTTVAVFYESQNDSKRIKLEFDQHATELKVALEKSILTHINVLRSLESFYAASTTVEREEFRTFVARPLATLQGIQALEWSPIIPSSEREAFEKNRQHEDSPNFNITELDTDNNQIVRAGNRSEYAPVSFVEPYRKNEKALGYDLYSNDIRREAANRAKNTGEITLTARITLIQNHDVPFGVLAFMPIYRNGFPHETEEERRSHILGYVIEVVQVEDIVAVALEQLNRENLSYRLIDETAPVAEQLLFSSDPKGGNPVTLQEKGLFGRNFSLVSHSLIPVGGRLWRFEIFPTLDYFAYHRSDNIWLILLAGLILSSMVSVFVIVSSGRGRLLIGLVEERTAALEKSEVKLRKLFELSPLGIAMTDMSGRFIEFNEAFLHICGYSSDELKAIDYWTLTPQKYEPMEQQQLQSLSEIGRYGPYDKEYLRKDGTLIPLRLNGVLVKGTDENDYIWSIVEDISASKAAEETLRQAKATADGANQAKGEFLANMSHEIRTPMNAIIGLSHLALNKELSAEIRGYLEKIYSSSNSLLGILNDILDFSKLEAGRLTIDRSPFNLDEILYGISNLFAGLAEEKHLDLKIDITPDVPRGLIGDALRLQQVLVNLLSNAIKFTERGEVTLRITVLNTDSSRVRLLFSVADAGIGISVTDRAKLFQPFSQVDGSITRRFGGTGLGLVISHNLLQLMDSEFSIDSTPGKGSCFSFELVLGIASLAEQPLSGTSIPLSGTSGKSLAGIRVLVAEDNLINQKVVQEFLNLSGVFVEIANNGKEAMALLEKGAFDAVLMDIHMPEMDGVDTTKLIRSQSRFAKLPVIALTAGVTTEERERCMASGMNDFIAKPVHSKQLISTLAQWVEPVRAVVTDKVVTGSMTTKLSDINDLPDFDLSNLLVMLGNNQQLATQLLVIFMENMKNLPEEIEEMIAAEDLVSARELAHKIKGASGNIGAIRLHAAAEALENELKKEQFAASFKSFLDAFKQTMSVIATLEQPEDQPPTEGNIEAQQTIAAELDRLLKENDFISETLLNTFKSHLVVDQLDLFAQLHKLINGLRYDEARKMLRLLIELPDIREA